MPSQQAETLDTIHALKRALRREREAATDQPISSSTNRGNKLKKGASYVHAGALPYPHGPDGYKQQIEHAGYTRYVLDRNPRRYNEYGDELEDSESDQEADADAQDENPYSGVHLEELLCPLKHPSELATHPTLSIPFLDSALPEMVKSTEEKLMQERVNLWRAKHLHRQLIGDESWMPCSAVETKDDWDLFEPRPQASVEQSKKRKRDSDPPTQDGDAEQEHTEVNGTKAEKAILDVEDQVATIKELPQSEPETDETTSKAQIDNPTIAEHTPLADDVEMEDAEPTTNGFHPTSASQDHPSQQETVPNAGDIAEPEVDGEPPTTEPKEPTSTSSSPKATPPPPPRRITRALAAETNPTSNAASPPTFPSPTISTMTSSLLEPDPIFLLPPHLHRTHPPLPLPVDEILDTMKLLTMYIQKQEETIRSTEAVLMKLLKAKDMRDRVFEWCKAEGHVGEWSDGEDWIDAEYWGEREEDLKKGKDEEEVGGGHDHEGEGGVGIQGGKKKRRTRKERE